MGNGRKANKKPASRKPRKRGRVTKLTPAVQGAIVKSLMDGNYFNVACAAAGVDDKTGYEWLACGENRDPDRPTEPEFAEFADAIRRAEAEAEKAIVSSLKRKGRREYRAAVEYLARRYPDRWGNKAHVEHSGPGGGPIRTQTSADLSGLSDDELDKFIGNLEAAVRIGSAREIPPGSGVGLAGVDSAKQANANAGTTV